MLGMGICFFHVSFIDASPRIEIAALVIGFIKSQKLNKIRAMFAQVRSCFFFPMFS